MSRTIQIRLPAVVRQDEDTKAFISYVPKLDLYSAAMTEEEAVQAAQSAVDLFFKTAAEKGTLLQVLLETELLSTGEKEPVLEEDHKFYTGTPLHLGYGLACV
jgi:predicted RNase H-like HicB family nuclease